VLRKLVNFRIGGIVAFIKAYNARFYAIILLLL
jgi:hypothetical protein